jgi:uncharacterized repeat protein (TIGR03806 family)
VDRLSQLGIFEEPLAKLVPRAGVAPYDVNVSLYSDGAEKQRFMILPPGTHLSGQGGDAPDRWQVPTGTYFVKNFYFPKDARDASSGVQLIETRFLVKLAQGYEVSTYLWDADQLDAVASGGNVDVPVQWIDASGAERLESFHVPGTSLCQSCHSDRALGIRTRQMDVQGTYPGGLTNQIDHLVASGLLDARPAEPVVLVDPSGGASLDARARSYLDANCSHCHGPQGLAAGTGVLFDYEHTTHGLLPLCRPTETVDGKNHVIVPGQPNDSEFLARMESSDPFVRMPMGPTRIPDGLGIAVLSQWVAAMTPAGCP